MRRIALLILVVGCSNGEELLGQGAACKNTSQCQAGLSCLGPSGETTCRPLGVAGEPCWSKDSYGCATGFVCSQSVCVTPGARKSGDPCSYNVDCASNLICNWSNAPFVCTAPALVGEPCGNDTDCVEGLVCPSKAFEARTCDCPTCGSTEVCGATGCIAPGTVARGKACGHNADCATGLVCVWAEKPYVCAPPRKLGEPCGHPTDCAEGLGCGNDATCRTACETEATCAQGEVCVGVCQPPSALGGSCGDAADCVAGLVCASAKTCAEPKQAGEACTSASDCLADLWCDSKTWTCVPDLELGGACSLASGGDAACKAPLECVIPCAVTSGKIDGTCSVRLPKDSACTPCTVTESQATICEASPLLCDAGCEVGLVCAGAVCATPPKR